MKGDVEMNVDWQEILIVIFFIIIVTIQFSLNKIILILKEIDKSLKKLTNGDRIHREG